MARARNTCSRTARPSPTRSGGRVPLSVDAGDFTRRGQLRYFALNLGKKATLSKIVLESYDVDIVPVTVAITASTDPSAGSGLRRLRAGPFDRLRAGPNQGPKEGGRGDAPLPETKPIVWAPGKTKVLIIGGGNAHNFGQFFGATDSATLSAAGFSVNYTEDRDQAAAEIGKADVAVISVNRQFFDAPEYRKALLAFCRGRQGPGDAASRGLVQLSAVAGAQRHDRRRRRARPRPIAAYSVNAVKPDIPS